MKLIKYMIAAMALVLLPTSQALAGGGTTYYKAKLTVNVETSGAGKVYASKASEDLAIDTITGWAESMSAEDQTETENATLSFWAYAKAEAGKKFIKWSDENTNPKRSYSIVSQKDNAKEETLTAIFGDADKYKATFLVPNNGSYTVDTAAITEETTAEYCETVAIALSATEANGYGFLGWYTQEEGQEPVYFSGKASTTLTMPAKNIKVGASFYDKSMTIPVVASIAEINNWSADVVQLNTDINAGGAALTIPAGKRLILNAKLTNVDITYFDNIDFGESAYLEDKDAQAKLSGKKVAYTDINKAIADWTDGSTLTLLADVTVNSTVKRDVYSSTSGYLLDLGTYRWTAKGCDAFQFTARGTESMASNYPKLEVFAKGDGGITVDSGKYAFYPKDNETETKAVGKNLRQNIRVTGGHYKGGFCKTDNNNNSFNTSNFHFQNNGSDGPLVVDGSSDTHRAYIWFKSGTYEDQFSNYINGGTQYFYIDGGKFKKLPKAGNTIKSTTTTRQFYFNSKYFSYDGSYYYVTSSEPEYAVKVKYDANSLKTFTGWSYPSAVVQGMRDYVYLTRVSDAFSKDFTKNELIFNKNVKCSTSKDVSTGDKFIIDVSAEGAEYTGSISLKNSGASFEIRLAPGCEYKGTVTPYSGTQLHVVRTEANGKVVYTYTSSAISSENAEAQIGDMYYTTVYDAFYAVDGTKDKKILLLKDVSDATLISNGRSADGITMTTIDLQGHAFALGGISSSNTKQYTLIIEDSVGGGRVNNTESSFVNIGYKAYLSGAVQDGGKYTLVIKGGTWQFNPTSYELADITVGFVPEGYEAVNNGNNTWTVREKPKTVNVSVPAVPGMTVVVKVGESVIEGVNGVYAVDPGSQVDVTYTADAGYCGKTVTKTIASAEEGSSVTLDDAEKAKKAVAQVGETLFATLAEAVAAANGGEAVTLLANCSGDGISINKSVTIDFGGFTYTMNGDPTGSTGTKTQAFQLLKGNDIVFTNGTITSSTAKMLVQNYANLTLADITLDGSNLADTTTTAYTLSTNNGTTEIIDSTITARATNGVAFDVCCFDSYTANKVTLTSGTINGNIELSTYNDVAPALDLNGGTINGSLAMSDNADKVVVTKAAGVTLAAPAGYQWDANGYLKKAVAKIGNTYHLTLVEAVSAATAGQTVTLLASCSGDGISINKSVTIDFGGFAYTMNGDPTGSTGTKTQAFQLLKGNDIVFTNGTITSSTAKMLVQNYANLTLADITLDGSTLVGDQPYTLSNNAGTTTIGAGTKIIAKEGGIAFDCYYWPKGGYADGVRVTVEAGATINGAIEYAEDGSDFANFATRAVVTKDASVEISAPAGYKWDDNGKLVTTVVADTGDEEENIVAVKTQEQTSTVDESALAKVVDANVTVVVDDKEVKVAEKIASETKVEGVKLTVEEKTVETSSGEMTTGVQAVIDAAKAKAVEEADTAFNSAIATTKAIEVKVEVKVEPTVVAVQAAAATAKRVTFDLKPEAKVTVKTVETVGDVEKVVEHTQVVPVTNDMIDKEKKIAVSFFTGFSPKTVFHYADDGEIIDVFKGDAIAYNANTGVTTVMIDHFSFVDATDEDYVAQIGTTKYTSLADAIAALQSNQVVEMLVDGSSLDLPQGWRVFAFQGKNYLIKIPEAIVTGPTVDDTEYVVVELTDDVDNPDYVTDLKPEFAYTFASQPGETMFDGWYVDWVVSANKDVAKNSLGLLGGYYVPNSATGPAAGFFKKGMQVNLGFFAPVSLTANQKVPLLNFMTKKSNWTYEQIRDVVQTFRCGAFNLSTENVGTTITVELRLFAPNMTPADIRDSSKWQEGVNTFTVETRAYTFDAEKVLNIPEADPIKLPQDWPALTYGGIATAESPIPMDAYYLSEGWFVRVEEGPVAVTEPTAYFKMVPETKVPKMPKVDVTINDEAEQKQVDVKDPEPTKIDEEYKQSVIDTVAELEANAAVPQAYTGIREINAGRGEDEAKITNIVVQLKAIKIEDIVEEEFNKTCTSATFDVTPIDANSNKVVLAKGEMVTFRLPVSSNLTMNVVKVFHQATASSAKEFLGYYDVQGADAEMYVEITASDFSYYGYEALQGEANPVCVIGDYGYATVTAAADAVQDGGTIGFIKNIAQDVTVNAADKAFTLDFDGYSLTGKVAVAAGNVTFAHVDEMIGALSAEPGASIVVTQGWYSEDPNAFAAAGYGAYQPEVGGLWKVVPNVAQVGETQYPTLELAIAAAHAGEVKLVTMVRSTAESAELATDVMVLAPAGITDGGITAPAEHVIEKTMDEFGNVTYRAVRVFDGVTVKDCADDEGVKKNVAIPKQWLLDNDVTEEMASNTTYKAFNGIPIWKNYVLGMDPWTTVQAGQLFVLPQDDGTVDVAFAGADMSAVKTDLVTATFKFYADVEVLGEFATECVQENNAYFENMQDAGGKRFFRNASIGIIWK